MPRQEHSVMLGYCVPPLYEGMIHEPFAECMLQFFTHDSSHNRYCKDKTSAVGSYIPEARNQVVTTFLQTKCDWLWFLDFDMIFRPDSLDKLLEVADPIKYPIVGALYFNKFKDGIWPTWIEHRDGCDFYKVSELKGGEIKELTACGMGCTLIHRSVFEKLQLIYSHDPWPWYGHDIVGGKNDVPLTRAGEDVTFCFRAREAGFKVHGATSINCTHLKSARLDWPNFANTSSPKIEIVDRTLPSSGKVLNVGGGSHQISIPAIYNGWESVLVDIDPQYNPDIVADARDLSNIPEKFESVYASHMLEHFHPDDVSVVLTQFRNVLKQNGFIFIRVPDMGVVGKLLAEGHSIEDVVYTSPAGPITIRDMIYGYGPLVKDSEHQAHKTGFNKQSLEQFLNNAGFVDISIIEADYELVCIAFLSQIKIEIAA